jgi:hypothetical protein
MLVVRGAGLLYLVKDQVVLEGQQGITQHHGHEKVVAPWGFPELVFW